MSFLEEKLPELERVIKLKMAVFWVVSLCNRLEV
jgi:hypothetical protein